MLAIRGRDALVHGGHVNLGQEKIKDLIMPHAPLEGCSAIRVLIHLHDLHAVGPRRLRNFLDFGENILVRNINIFPLGKTV